MRLLSSVVVGSVLVTAAVGCKRNEGGGGGERVLAEEAIESSAASEDEAALFASVAGAAQFAPGVVAATPDDAAGQIASHLPDAYPACVTVTRSGLSVSVVFDGCIGPLGLTLLDGTVVFTVVSVSDTSLTVDANATDFILNGARLDLDATGTFSSVGGTRSIAVSSRTSGTGALGNEFTHTGDYTASWDATCASIDGSWSTAIDESARSTTASLERCEGSCPTGTISRDTFDGRTIDVTFDGTSTVRWTSSTGRSGTIELLCGN